MKLLEVTIPPGDIDNVLKAYRVPCRFILQPGDYTTRGIWNFLTNFDCCMLPPQSELIGAGSQLTNLKLSNPVMSTAGSGIYPQYAVLTGGNRISGSNVLPASRTKVSGLTIDCAYNMPTIGLQLWTSNAIVEDVIVNNVWGNRDTNWEGFGILINNSGNPNQIDGGHVVRNCKVYVKSGAYATGLYVGCVQRKTPLEHSVVENCKVLSYEDGSLPHAAYGINSQLTIKNCESYGFNHVIFNDTSDTYNTLINDCVFRKTGYAYMALRANKSGWHRENVITNNCIIEFDSVSSDHVALLVCDDQSPTKDQSFIKNILIKNSIITNKTEQTFYLGSINGKNFLNIGLISNILPLKNSGAVIVTPSEKFYWIDRDNTLM
jgi:hypothetical protein